MTQPLLTIAIPTYNREICLKNLIPGLILQCNEFPGEIEILVKDNASPDGTSKYIRDLMIHLEKHPATCLRYSYNETNIGADANFIRCVKEASGEYVWIFGDDEILNPAGIAKVISCLRDRKYDLLIVKDKTYDTGLTASVSFESYRKLTDFMARTNPHFVLAHTLITSNIFRKTLFDTIYAEHMLNSTYYSHMYAIMANLSTWGNVFVLNDPIIEVRKKRMKFEDYRPFIYWYQFKYLRYIGKTFGNDNIMRFAFKFLIKSSPRAIYNIFHETIR